MQADTVIMTNQNQRSEAPEEIIRDIITGFPDEILDNNARKPWAGGFLQDPSRVSPTVREFLFYHQNVYDSQADSAAYIVFHSQSAFIFSCNGSVICHVIKSALRNLHCIMV